MTSFLIAANCTLKLACAALFASDGDFTAAAVFVIATPISSWLIAQ